MSHRGQAYYTSDGFLGGAFVVVGFVVLVVVTAVDLIASRWSSVPTFGTDQAKDDPGSKPASVAPLQADDSSTPRDVAQSSAQDQKPLSDTRPLDITPESSVPPPKDTDPAVRSEQGQQLGSPPIRDLDEERSAKIEQAKTEVPLVEEEDSRQAEPNAASIHEAANDSSQEWVSLSKPDVPLPPTNAGDVQSEPTLAPPDYETPQADVSPSAQQQEPASTLEFSSATLVDAPNKLHETAMTIRSDTSSPPPPPDTPEPDTHSFDAAARIRTDAEKQIPLNPESSADFGAVNELKGRTSSPSLHSASGSINRGSSRTPPLSVKKKRGGGSFIKKSSTLVNKVFKNREGSGDSTNVNNDSARSSIDNPALSSSVVSESENLERSTSGPDADGPPKKLTSPSRVSLGSIRSIGGSIKKKMGKSSSATGENKDVASVTTQDQEPLVASEESPSNSGQPSTGPSLLKTMFKVRRPSK